MNSRASVSSIENNPLEQCLSDGSLRWIMDHENRLQEHPYDINSWFRYLDSLDDAVMDSKVMKDLSLVYRVRDWVGRRALALFPRSYKLWKNHWEFLLQKRQQQFLLLSPDDVLSMILHAWERCLETLSSFPRVWIEYITFLKNHPGCTSVTHVRRTINRALQSLPLTQHDKIWPAILDWIYSTESSSSSQQAPPPPSVDSTLALPATITTIITWNIPLESQICLLRRYCLYNPLYRNEFAEFLIRQQQWGEAAIQYQILLNLTTTQGTRDLYWQAFAELCTQHPLAVEQAGVEWEPILRAVLFQQKKLLDKKNNEKKSDSSAALFVRADSQSNLLEGLLWTQLADSWIRRGSFDIARSVFEEGLRNLCTVRDFAVLYDAYIQFEEGLLEAATNALEQEEEETGDNNLDHSSQQNTDNDDWDIILIQDDSVTSPSKLADMELALARAEHLTSRRPLLLNAVVLRQNPNSVRDWLERADLYLSLNLSGQATAALEEALKTVDAHRVTQGRPSQLVLKLAGLYEMTDVNMADDLYHRICQKLDFTFQKADDLAECWAGWVELALRQEEWDRALSLARQSVAPGAGPRKLNLTKSVRLWDLLLDLEESLGTVQTTKDAYNQLISEKKAATVQHILNFASFLNERQYFEESFAAYEKGIELFAFPHVGANVLWKSYLLAFTSRYQGAKVERTRDLFQRCLEQCPPEASAEFFLMNGEYEESYGLAKRALSVYQAMCRRLPVEEKFVAYKLFIAKTTKYLGVIATREIYQEAIDTLKDQEAARICMDFAGMEAVLQEIERARAIFVYGAQMADPRRVPEFWKAWNEFEIYHGNEETFREMLRVKRGVEAAFSTVNRNMSTVASDPATPLTDEQAMQMIAEQEGVDHVPGVTPNSNQQGGFVPSSESLKRKAELANLDEVKARVAQLRKVTAKQDDADMEADKDGDEINIDDIDAEIEEAAASGFIPEEEKVSIPEEEEKVPVEHSDKSITTKAVPQGVFGGLKTQQSAPTNY